MGHDSDTVLRALTDDGGFRVITLETTSTVRGAIEAQKVQGGLCRTFGNLLTGAILIRESMSPDLRVQAFLQSDDQKSRLVADSFPDGNTRGLVQIAKDASRTAEMPIGKGGLLQVARTLHNGALHQGVIAVPDNGNISSALMTYMQESEQTVTMISVGCHMVGGEVVAAGGLLVQLLPELSEDLLAIMTERLKDFENIEPLLAQGKASAEELLAETLYGMPYARVAERQVQFGCTCSQARLAASLATLPRADIESMIADGKMLDIECDFCGKKYDFSPEQLRGLLDSN
jgi:molecular chaperone Hsp33